MIATYKGFLGASTESKKQHIYCMYQQEKFSKLTVLPYSALQHDKNIFLDLYNSPPETNRNLTRISPKLVIKQSIFS